MTELFSKEQDEFKRMHYLLDKLSEIKDKDSSTIWLISTYIYFDLTDDLSNELDSAELQIDKSENDSKALHKLFLRSITEYS